MGADPAERDSVFGARELDVPELGRLIVLEFEGTHRGLQLLGWTSLHVAAHEIGIIGGAKPAAEPAAPEEIRAPEPQPTLTVRLEVDFAAGEARVLLDEASEPVRLRFEAGAWRHAPPSA